MTMVPWSVLDPAQIERIIGVLLGRELRRSIRIRPARGDGGIDVLDPLGPLGTRRADVYQIKSFSSALTPDQKRQVKNSLLRVADNQAVTVRDWYLVLPLNPSPPEREWFIGLDSEVGFDCHWYGLDRLDGLAAAYQDVIDHYLGDGRRRLEESISQLRSLVGLAPTTSGQLLSPDDTLDPLTALYQLLNRDDPHYRYEFEVGAVRSILEPPRSSPWLVASVTRGQGDVAVTHHIHARYLMATLDRPIPLTFTVEADGMDSDLRQAWERTLRYGTPVTLPASTVREVSFDLPGGLDGAIQEATLRFGAAQAGRAKPYRLRLRLTNPDGEMVNQVVLDMESPTRGLIGSGWRVHGFAPGRAFEVVMTYDSTELPATVNVTVTAGEFTGAQPAALRPGVRFLADMRSPNRLQLAPEHGPPPDQPFPCLQVEAPVPEALVELIEALADLQENVAAHLRTPDLENLSDKAAREILRAARLVRGETVRDTWTEHEFNITPTGPPLADESAPSQLAISGSYQVSIGDQTFILEPVTSVLLAAELNVVGDGNGTVAVRAVPALGNDTMVTRMAPIDDVPPEPVQSE